MAEGIEQRNRAIYEEFIRLRGSTRYSNVASLHQALGVMFGTEDAPLSPNTIRKIIGEQRRVDYAKANDLPLDAVPPGFFVKKLSTLLDVDGNTITQSIQSVNESRRSTEHQDAIPAGHRVKGVSTYLDEQVGCYVESHATPAPGDAYSDRMGYRSRHSMCSIVYDPIGEYSRNTVQVRPPTPRDEESKTPPHVVTFPAESEVEATEDVA